MTFGERLKMLRKEHGMTLEEVACAVGIGRATVYKYENGMIANVPPARVHALAQLFGVTRPYLMGWTGEREINPAENLDMVAVKMRCDTPGISCGRRERCCTVRERLRDGRNTGHAGAD